MPVVERGYFILLKEKCEVDATQMGISSLVQNQSRTLHI